jgi:Ca-activated chloride channel homolog
MIRLTSKLGYSVVDYTKDNENYLLLTLTGDVLPSKEQRPPISIVGLLDISSSMSPEFKIGYLKKSVIKLIDNLSTTDRLALVVYSTNAKVVMELTTMTAEAKKKAMDIVNKLTVQSMTNISQAITLGFNEFKDKITQEGINRIILFTDGVPTAGNCDKSFLIDLASKAPDGVQVTTMGYGKPNNPAETNGLYAFGMGGELDVKLLESIAEKGKGNYYYMSDPDSCGRAFANELAGLLTVVGQNIKITVTPKNGHISIDSVLDDYDVEDINGAAVITIPDIISEESKYILLKVKTPKQLKAWARPANVVDIKVDYINVIDGKVEELYGTTKITFASKGFTKDMDSDVKTQLEVINAIKAQEEAYTLAQAGDYQGAVKVMEDAIGSLGDVGTERASSYLYALNTTKDFCDNSVSFTANANVMSAGVKAMKSCRGAGSLYDTIYCTSAQNDMQNAFTHGESNTTTKVTVSIQSDDENTVTLQKKTKTSRW